MTDPAQPAPTAPPAPSEFVLTALGPRSSHPYWRRRRWQTVARYGLGAIVALGLTGLLVVLNFRSFGAFVASVHTLLLGLGGVVVVALSSVVTLVLLDRIADLKGSGEIEGGLGRDVVDAPTVAITAVVGVVGPLVLAQLPGIPTTVRLGANLLAILPLFGILIGIRVLEGRRSGRSGRPVLGLVLLVLVALLLVSLLQTAAGLLGSHPAARWVGHVVTAAPAAVVAYALFLAFPRPHRAAQAATDATPEAPSWRDRLAAFWDWLWRAVSRRGPPAEALTDAADAAPAGPPAWLAQVLAGLPAGCEVMGDADALTTEDAPGPADRPELRPVFAGLDPTVEQAAFLDRFNGRYERAVRHVMDSPGGDGEPCPDLLLLGHPGTGRTTTLLACALDAVFVRGQHVLVLVPTASRRDAMVETFAAYLRGTGFHHYVRAVAVASDPVARWLTDDEPMPRVVVGTLDDVETHLCGAPTARPDDLLVLRDLLGLLEVVLVDDFLDFSEVERSHLPFFLAKHRLLLAADHVPMQAVVSCIELTPLAETMLAERLFPVADREQVATLHHRRGDWGWHVDLEAPDITAAVDALVRACLQVTDPDTGEGLDIILYRRGIDDYTRRAQQQALSTLPGPGRVTVLGNADQRLPDGVGRIDAVIHHVSGHGDACLTLRVRFGNDRAVVFSVRPPGEVTESGTDGVVPIVADRSAPPLLVAHLRSVLRFLPPATPIPMALWDQFGLSTVRPPQGRVTSHLARLERDELKDPRYTARDLWPYAVVQHAVTGYEPVVVHELPRSALQLVSSRSGATVYLTAPPPLTAPAPSATSRWCEWQRDSGARIRDLDLAHAGDLLITVGRDVLVPQRAGLTGNRFEVVATHWQGDGSDVYRPMWDLAWSVPPGTTAGGHQGGGQHYGMAWFDLHPAPDQDVTARATLRGRMDDSGRITVMQTVSFEYAARLSVLVLGPGPLDPDHLDTLRGQHLTSAWSSRSPSFQLPLTSALAYAFDARVPGLSFFARTLAYAPTGPEDPASACRTPRPSRGSPRQPRSWTVRCRQLPPAERQRVFETPTSAFTCLRHSGREVGFAMQSSARLGESHPTALSDSHRRETQSCNRRDRRGGDGRATWREEATAGRWSTGTRASPETPGWPGTTELTCAPGRQARSRQGNGFPTPSSSAAELHALYRARLRRPCPRPPAGPHPLEVRLRADPERPPQRSPAGPPRLRPTERPPRSRTSSAWPGMRRSSRQPASW